MEDSEARSSSKVLRANDFRYIPCDAVSLAISDHGVKLTLAVEEVDGGVTELVGVHLPFRTAMILKTMLAKGLDHYQKETGNTLEEPKLSENAES